MNKYFREPVNALTHLSGAFIFLIGLVLLLYFDIARSEPTFLSILALAIFGLSLILLYSTSGIYHGFIGNVRKIGQLKKLDHAMIYVLIAGTYTPLCLLSLEGIWKYGLLGAIWTIAVLGIVLAAVYINLPRFITTAIYILMGWLAIIAIIPLYHAIAFGGVFFLVLGGVVYTAGGVIYGLKKPNLFSHLGFHELFHIFVIAGSLCHYWVILRYIILR